MTYKVAHGGAYEVDLVLKGLHDQEVVIHVLGPNIVAVLRVEVGQRMRQLEKHFKDATKAITTKIIISGSKQQ